ncbi:MULTISPECIES: energy transducer TonB [Flavobacterium]|uniref:energy transducer TonB n=1 Tax=Flavobacterium TaxID=237 RepID=UPI001FCC3038|nr:MULTISPECIES: energy transducer TonB [Flavobacterium]UOK43601.1 energy transducer TonB [Flavobacterium enshiense]
MSKLNLFKTEWIDIIFEGRNKAYGAYKLRSESPKTTSRALVIGALLFASVIAAPVIENIISQRLAKDEKENMDKVIETALLPPPPPKEDLPPPPPPEPPKSVNDQVKFPPPEVVKKELVRDEDPPTVEDLKEADPGQKDVKGDKNAEIVIDQPTGEGDKAAAVVEDDNKVYVAVEVQAGPNGGMPGFYKKFASSFSAPEVDEGVSQIRVMLSFVVEKDGSFTDVKVLRDPGYGAGKEAIRVLKSMPNWKPAIQNGRPVRSQFTLPITIQVAQ